VSWLWVLNALLFVAFCVWIWNDVRFMEPSFAWSPYNRAKSAAPPPSREVIPMTAGRWLTFRILRAAAAVSFAGILAALFLGAARHRRLRAWLAVIGLAAAWLALATSWRDLAWAGRRWCAAGLVTAYEPLAAALRREWPQHDDAKEGFGPFSAYPAGKPQMLMLLTRRTPESATVPFVGVERSAVGALRFDLEGRLADVWLEWHPPGSAPQSFTGGLETQYTLQRASALGAGWYAATYESRLAR
jgi:hypothetical protein